MTKKQVYVSAEGLKKLQERLEYLKTTGRKEAAEEIKKARAFGDLSENSEYDEAKNHQGLLEKEIAELEEQLENAVVIEENASTDTVTIGSKVKVFDIEFEEETSPILKSAAISSSVLISCPSDGDQPNKATKFTSASVR